MNRKVLPTRPTITLNSDPVLSYDSNIRPSLDFEPSSESILEVEEITPIPEDYSRGDLSMDTSSDLKGYIKTSDLVKAGIVVLGGIAIFKLLLGK